ASRPPSRSSPPGRPSAGSRPPSTAIRRRGRSRFSWRADRGPRSARAQIAAGGKILLTAPAEAIEQERLHFQVPNDGTFEQTRLCTRSSTAAKLSGGDRDD